MLLDLDVQDRRVVIFGEPAAAASTARRFARARARVRLVCADRPIPPRPTLRHRRLPTRPARSQDTAGLLKLLAPAWLVVTAGPPDELSDRVRVLCHRLKIVHTHHTAGPTDKRGRVVLVGGGPGTSRLLTIEACEALLDADVVFYDRLAPTDDLDRLAPGAELVDVGKLPYHHPTSQHRIQELIIERARRGQVVVRLKGGDPFVFGRGGEEVRACRAAGVEVRVVPGVTSAVSVPAAAGIPVTHRGTAEPSRSLSGHLPLSGRGARVAGPARRHGGDLDGDGRPDADGDRAGRGRALRRHPAAVVERGFSDSQRTTTGRLADLPALVGRLGVTSPAVVVIGDVAAFAAEQVGSGPLRRSTPCWPIPAGDLEGPSRRIANRLPGSAIGVTSDRRSEDLISALNDAAPTCCTPRR